jgi:hypothetical protein
VKLHWGAKKAHNSKHEHLNIYTENQAKFTFQNIEAANITHRFGFKLTPENTTFTGSDCTSSKFYATFCQLKFNIDGTLYITKLL